VGAFIMILPRFLRFCPIWSHLAVLTWTPIQNTYSLAGSRLATAGGAGRKSGVAPRFCYQSPPLATDVSPSTPLWPQRAATDAPDCW